LSNNFVVPRFVAQAVPPHTEGMRIGLLGGSFNPPHQAHRAISRFALAR
jgi:nicotinate-nucleotide adenylyltransferase